MYPAMWALLFCHSTKNPRPLSSGFHHQPASGTAAGTGVVSPLGTNGNLSIGVAPPGQIIVPCVASENARVTFPIAALAAGRYAPVRVWPPEARRKSPV